MRKVTASHSLLILASPEAVWDFTQNWNRRPEWDFTIARAKVLSEKPRAVWAFARGGLELDVRYKLFDRPKLTTLSMRLDSFWIKGGGGSWKYEPAPGGTLWTQNNTLELRPDAWGALSAPGFARLLRWMTKKMMIRAKTIIESGGEGLFRGTSFKRIDAKR